MTFINKLARDEDGATAIEYGLIAALIAVGLITALGALGTSLSGTFQKVSTDLNTANTQAGV
ncbi:Flp family type IVb pilin [Porphyrobacter sp. GA68]|uniref:Flp family type IVb pilin n=1 Tax=Porphyrobacter sp. GA68 TaxID=2883480 RepID=UPI001D180C86|nr:Flp family type IVb pilin [Porphyrobacter sp. GA68]